MTNISAKTDLNNTDHTIDIAKTHTETDTTCPQCGATLDYDPSTGGLHCTYCDYRVVIDTTQGQVEELDFEQASHRDSLPWGRGTKQITCHACGATTIYDEHEIAEVCPFCGSNQVMMAYSVDSLAPNTVAPFVVTAKDASALFMRWFKSRLFTPSEAKRNAHTETFRGLYLPYFTFDAETTSSFRADCGQRYKTTDENGRPVTRIRWSVIEDRIDVFANDVTVLASTQHDVSLLRRIEPFDFTRLVPYRPEFLAGFAAERYSTGLDDAWLKARERIKERIEERIKALVRHDYDADLVNVTWVKTSYSDRTYKYALLPIWLSSFSYRGHTYHLIVNGQTGAVAARLPYSIWRILVAVALVIALLVVVFVVLHAWFQ